MKHEMAKFDKYNILHNQMADQTKKLNKNRVQYRNQINLIIEEANVSNFDLDDFKIIKIKLCESIDALRNDNIIENKDNYNEV